MRLNSRREPSAATHEGAPAKIIGPEQRLRRSVLSCLLWEDEFYEDGESIADRIVAAAEAVPPAVLAQVAREARQQYNLRHAPLLLLTVLAKTGSGNSFVSETIADTISRADELSEFLALYWRNGKTPLAAQVKKGLARAFRKFDAYQFAKYDRGGPIKLRDVLFMVHAKPGEGQAETFRALAERELESPDTWEVALSGGADKKDTFERLIREDKLGYLALLRNLRNMAEAGCDMGLVRDAIIARKGARRVLPFRYVAAARACPQMEPALDEALSEAIAEMPPLEGKTLVVVDVSTSMDSALSRKSDMTRMDAAAALASIIHGDLRMFSFSAGGRRYWGERWDGQPVLVEVPPRRGMAGVAAIVTSQQRAGTLLGQAVKEANAIPHDRLIVITDEQSQDRVPDPVAKLAYMINVASNQNGVGYGRWTHIDGFSEQVLRFIVEYEAARTG